jgi:hypothetical protein
LRRLRASARFAFTWSTVRPVSRPAFTAS